MTQHARPVDAYSTYWVATQNPLLIPVAVPVKNVTDGRQGLAAQGIPVNPAAARWLFSPNGTERAIGAIMATEFVRRKLAHHYGPPQ